MSVHYENHLVGNYEQKSIKMNLLLPFLIVDRSVNSHLEAAISEI